jgi:hypothetical protein
MGAPAVGENLKLLDFWQSYSDAPNALYKEIAAEAYVSLGARADAVARLSTREEWQRYRQHSREKLMDLVGPFPERTPLNARVLGVVKKEDFRIEKIVYESQPGLFVTAALSECFMGMGRPRPVLLGHRGGGAPAPECSLVFVFTGRCEIFGPAR